MRHLFTTRGWDIQSAADVRRVIDAAGWFAADRPPAVVMSRQMHGHAVGTPDRPLAEADAHVAVGPATVVAVRTADCVPVLLASGGGRVVAAVHAGWRGLDPAVNVIGRAVAAMREVAGGVSAAEAFTGGWVAAVGPCVSAARYEVGEEVAGLFRTDHRTAVRDGLGEKPRLDTRRVAVEQLAAAGLGRDAIDVFPGCTYDDAEMFFSYRRQGKGVGHLAALIGPRG